MYQAGFSTRLRRSTAGVMVLYQPIPISEVVDLVAVGQGPAARPGPRPRSAGPGTSSSPVERGSTRGTACPHQLPRPSRSRGRPTSCPRRPGSDRCGGRLNSVGHLRNLGGSGGGRRAAGAISNLDIGAPHVGDEHQHAGRSALPGSRWPHSPWPPGRSTVGPKPPLVTTPAGPRCLMVRSGGPVADRSAPGGAQPDPPIRLGAVARTRSTMRSAPGNRRSALGAAWARSNPGRLRWGWWSRRGRCRRAWRPASRRRVSRAPSPAGATSGLGQQTPGPWLLGPVGSALSARTRPHRCSPLRDTPTPVTTSIGLRPGPAWVMAGKTARSTEGEVEEDQLRRRRGPGEPATAVTPWGPWRAMQG